jgi:hypothetical protein
MADPIKIGPFTGITNRRKRHALRDEATKTNALWAADNVDIDTTGRLARRAGYTLQTPLTAGDSLWCDGVNMYYRDNGTLYRDGEPVEAVGARCAYEKFPGGGVIYTDGSQLRYIDSDGTPDKLAPAAPEEVELSTTTGTLQPAKYLVSVTGVATSGVEGPATAYGVHELTAIGGIQVALPALPAGASSFRIYVSGPNGEVLAYHGTTSGSSHAINDYAEGMTLLTAGLAEMPGGSIVCIFNGRLLVADGNVVFISEPYNFGLYDPSLGYIVFPAAVTVIAPMQNGVYIVAGATYWVQGADIRQSEFFERLPYGAVAGTVAKDDLTELVYWMGVKGLVQADVNGEVKNLQERDLAINEGSPRGATLVLTDSDRIIVSTDG